MKFIRLSESLIEKNGEGILGFITNHGYLDNPTFRGMRWHLLNTFDRIHVLDLHGNAKKKEVAPDGGADKNVFDIQQGVAIIVAVRTRAKEKGLAKVSHGDLWGSRELKNAALAEGRIGKPLTEQIECKAPQFAFVRRNHGLADAYGEGLGLAEFMPEYAAGIVTAKDGLVIEFTKQGLQEKIRRFADPSKTDAQVRAEFFPSPKKDAKYPSGDSRGWKLPAARVALQRAAWNEDIKEIIYRPFDRRVILYRPDMVDWGRFDFIPQMMHSENFGIVFNRTVEQKRPYTDVFVFSGAVQHHSLSLKEVNYVAPLYLYPSEEDLDKTRKVNFDAKLYKRLREMATHPKHGTPDEVAVFDYIYGVLHCPAYRETFAEFLKTDFPRIPWPTSPDEFWDVSAKGTTLRKLHLMESAAIGETPFPFTGEGDGVVDKPRFAEGRVWINKDQYFDGVPEIAWNFYIGGYQPAQKWLKDRKGRSLGFEEVRHYQRIVKILAETDRIMKTITMKLETGAKDG